MKYGNFNLETGGFEITTPRTPTAWKMPLFNDNYVTFVDQLLGGKGSFLVPKRYNSKVINMGDRELWIRDNSKGNAYKLNDSKAEKGYKFTHYLDRAELTREFGEFSVTVTVFVPTKDSCEYWRVTIKNIGDAECDLSLFSHIGFPEYSGMGGTCKTYDNAIVKYTFPHHVFYDDKEKCEAWDEHYYFVTDTSPDSTDMSSYYYCGGYLTDSVPLAVKNGCCSNMEGEAEDFCGVFCHNVRLAKGEEKSLCFAIGVEKSLERIIDFSENFTVEFVSTELCKVNKYWQDITEKSKITTPDKLFDELANKWIKKQIVYLTRTNRMGTLCPVRNQLQDAMGYALFEPLKAKEFIYEVLKTERSDGYIKQWHTTNGAPLAGIGLLEHCDGPIWVTLCGAVLVSQIGDKSVLEDIIPYSDGGEGTLLEHLVRSLEYMSCDVGLHRICLMRDGDWTDPINGVGRKGRGESAWASMGVMFAAKVLGELLEDMGDKNYITAVNEIWEKTDKAVNETLWEENRYIGGFDDDGKPFADKADDDRVLLNVQTWAILSGAARGERVEKIKNTVDNITDKLGPYTIYPGFDGWNPQWGRISLKKNGTTENGAVYCHAAMFKAFSDSVLGECDAMLDTLYRVTPINPENSVENNRQLPLFLPNYYYSEKTSGNFGRSSCNYDTGTAAWFLMTILEGMFGMKATVNGIELTPCLPKDWDNVSCRRKYKNAVYNVTYKKSASGITLDGKPLADNLLPYEENKTYNIICGIE